MPLKRTPPQTILSSPSTSAFATPMQHYPSESNVSEVGQEAGVSAASSVSSLSTTASNTKSATSRSTAATAKRKRGEYCSNADEDLGEFSKAEIMTMFKTLQKQQDAKSEVILNSISDLRMSIDFMSARYDEVLEKLDFLESERRSDKNYIKSLEKRLELLDHNARCTSLEMRDVPQKPKETKDDLKQFVLNAAQSLEVPLQNNEIKDIYRLNSRAATKPIVIDFTTVNMRDSFLVSFKKYNKQHPHNGFKTTNMNIEGPSKMVFLSENLTQRERSLFYAARKFSKDYGYKYCWTSFGRVFMRKREGEPQIRINDENDLAKYRET